MRKEIRNKLSDGYTRVQMFSKWDVLSFGISSGYLAKVVAAESPEESLADVTRKLLDVIRTTEHEIRTTVSKSTDRSLGHGIHVASSHARHDGEVDSHIGVMWMTEDLCKLVASKYSINVLAIVMRDFRALRVEETKNLQEMKDKLFVS